MDDINDFVLEKVKKMLEEDVNCIKKTGNTFWPLTFGDPEHFGLLIKMAADLYGKEYENFKRKCSDLSRRRATNSEIAKAMKFEIDQLQKTSAFYKALASYLALQFKKSQMIDRFAEKKSVNF
jgi:hypothetical protein